MDPKKKTVLAGGGALWGDVDHATHAFGLAVPAGIISTTGVGGLTLGGGIGHLTRQCGLTIDNLLAVDMVLADGRFVTANAKENADLFWAVRGGGGNFGVVTSFLFKAHPIHTDYAGPMLWPLEDAAEMMRWYRELHHEGARQPQRLLRVSHGPAGAAVSRASAHQEDVRRRLVLYGPAEESRGGLQADSRVQDAGARSGRDRFRIRRSRACSTRSAAGPAVVLEGRLRARAERRGHRAARASTARQMPTMQSTMHLYPIDGAASRVKNSATPWAYRDAKWAQVIVGVDPDPANKEKIAHGPRRTGRRCIPTRPAART